MADGSCDHRVRLPRLPQDEGHKFLRYPVAVLPRGGPLLLALLLGELQGLARSALGALKRLRKSFSTKKIPGEGAAKVAE